MAAKLRYPICSQLTPDYPLGEEPHSNGGPRKAPDSTTQEAASQQYGTGHRAQPASIADLVLTFGVQVEDIGTCCCCILADFRACCFSFIRADSWWMLLWASWRAGAAAAAHSPASSFAANCASNLCQFSREFKSLVPVFENCIPVKLASLCARR